MSKWTKFATSFYKKKKRTNKNYKFSQALTDAAKVYNGGNDKKGGIGPGDGNNGVEGEDEQGTSAEVTDLTSVVEKDLTEKGNEPVTAVTAVTDLPENKAATETAVVEKDLTREAAAPGAAPAVEPVEVEQVEGASHGGKKAKKSAKKGKKSVKKGGKKGKKSAKKGKR
jgi:hypothetical protein